MSMTITVEGKVAGRKQPLFTDWHVILPPPQGDHGDSLRLRTLLSTIVVKEVEAFKGRQAERKLARLMSREQIEQSAQRGKIDPGQNDLSQSVDVDQAITTALQAFEDGLYYVFIDNVQQQGLDDEVVVNTNSKVVFLRLTALAGG